MIKSIITDPPVDCNFVAIYSDGSGAQLYCWDAVTGTLYDAEGNIHIGQDDYLEWLLDSGYMWWLPLPDDFPFWWIQQAVENNISEIIQND